MTTIIKDIVYSQTDIDGDDDIQYIINKYNIMKENHLIKKKNYNWRFNNDTNESEIDITSEYIITSNIN